MADTTESSPRDRLAALIAGNNSILADPSAFAFAADAILADGWTPPSLGNGDSAKAEARPRDIVVVLKFTEQQLFDLDAMVTEGFRAVRDDATDEQRAAGLSIVRRIDDNRRALLDGKRAPDAVPDGPTRTDLLCRIDDALSWIDEPDDLTTEQQLVKIRAVLDNGEKREVQP